MDCTTPAASDRQPAIDALRVLCAVARLYQVAGDPHHLAHHLGLSASETLGAGDITRAARHLGLQAKTCRTTTERLPLTPLPALARLHGRWVVVARCDGHQVLVQDPGGADPTPTRIACHTFASQWDGELVLLTRRASLAGARTHFDFSWFIPSLVKYRPLLGEVLLISFFLQLFALVSPLFFQVVMDKVLVHQGLTTLDVLVTGLLVVVVFESLLSGLRTYVFSHTTSRIEARTRTGRWSRGTGVRLPQAKRVGLHAR